MVPASEGPSLLPKWNLSQCILIPFPSSSASVAICIKSHWAAAWTGQCSWRLWRPGGLCIFASEWGREEKWEIVWWRFVLTDWVLGGLSVFSVSSRQFEILTSRIVGRKHGDHGPLWWQLLGKCEFFASPIVGLQTSFKFSWPKASHHVLCYLRGWFFKAMPFLKSHVLGYHKLPSGWKMHVSWGRACLEDWKPFH